MSALGIENTLLDGLRDIFAPTFVLEMDNETIDALGSESDEVQVKRAGLDVKLKKLRDGLKACQRQQTLNSRSATSQISFAVPLPSDLNRTTAAGASRPHTHPYRRALSLNPSPGRVLTGARPPVP